MQIVSLVLRPKRLTKLLNREQLRFVSVTVRKKTNMQTVTTSNMVSRTRRIAAILLMTVVCILSANLARPASAHEGRQVGDYNLVIGFLQEPAYEGQLNAVSLVVTRNEPHEPPPATGSTSDSEMSAGSDHDDGHSHDDGHAHSHDDDHAHSASTNSTDESDVLAHGSVFISPRLRRDMSFEYQITEELDGLGIPYHIHPGDLQGLITVTDTGQRQSDVKSVTITNGGVEPRRISVNVGDTIVWLNRDLQNAILMSGPLSSMTDEIRASIETSGATKSGSTSNRVTGLSPTLRVELTHLATSSSTEIALTEKFDDPGHYIAEFIPTAPGDYRVRFFGSIEGQPIDETFDSGPDTFDTVVPSDAIQFPVVLESNREIQNATLSALDAVQELQTEVDTTSASASTGIIIGIIGIIVGAVAVVASVIAITIARKRT